MSLILDHPSRVFNCDESAIYLSPKEKSVLTKKGAKTVYSFVANDEKECVTTLIMANAAGIIAPPMIVHKYKKIPTLIANSMPKGWAIGISENGWMTAETFYEYIANIFYAWLIESSAEFPIILFVDGHVSHLTLHLSNFCRDKKILLIALLPNSTHILQPLDVSFFHPLKLLWKTAIRQWRMEHNGDKIRKEHFAQILDSVLQNKNHKQNLINGFRSCGLCPFIVESINFEKYLGKASTSNIHKPEGNTQQQNPLKDDIARHIQFMEDNIDNKVLLEFNNTAGKWTGEEEFNQLFLFWKKIKILANDNHEPITNDDDENEDFFMNMNDTTCENNALTISFGENSLLNFELLADGSLLERTPLKEVAQEKVISPQEKVISPQSSLAIPTPFKRNLFWPDPKKVTTKKIAKEKIPAVVVSNQWIDYQRTKRIKKEEVEKNKLAKKKARETKTINNVKTKTLNIEEQSKILIFIHQTTLWSFMKENTFQV